jgi:Tol biopolymer transport system component
VERRVSLLTTNGGRLAWHHGRNLIAFDRAERGGDYQIYTMRPDGSEERCLTCEQPAAPPHHKGNPAWHPSGEYIVFIAEKASHRTASTKSTPGLGIDNDVWLMTADGTRYHQLTNVGAGMGVLHPHFSHDGSRVVWAERIDERGGINGTWTIKLAGFVVEGQGPRLADVQDLRAGQPAFYETHGFSRDDRSILFSATQESSRDLGGLDIYTLHLGTRELTRLTETPDDWDEHAHYSPDGRYIVWMSSRDCGCNAHNVAQLRTDYWIMNADGSEKRRLSGFNVPGAPEYAGERVVVGDFAWGPDGRTLTAYVIGQRGLADILGGLRGGADGKQRLFRIAVDLPPR